MTDKTSSAGSHFVLSRPTRRPAHQSARLTIPPQCFIHVHLLKSLRLGPSSAALQRCRLRYRLNIVSSPVRRGVVVQD